MRAQFIDSIHEISAKDWNALCGIDYPFLRHEFFAALEESGSISQSTGWQSHHLIVSDRDNTLLVMPLFLKFHSYGEYVFDWAWADAYHRYGKEYYPKLLNAIPFTPASGPRWGIANHCDQKHIVDFALTAIENEAEKNNYSSCHWLFPNAEQQETLISRRYNQRFGCQYHWFNHNYQSFDEFLASFNSRKRKNLKKERRRVVEQNISLCVKEADDISQEDWQLFYLFYHLTYFKRSGQQGYLSETFFPLVAKYLSTHLVMVQAIEKGEVIAAALYFKDSQTLYGRYWGAKEEYDQLHFEACYYQGIEYAIKHKLKRFDPGAQGEHKIQRGFKPTPTTSFHWLVDPQFDTAVRRFVKAEAREIDHYIKAAGERLPFRAPD